MNLEEIVGYPTMKNKFKTSAQVMADHGKLYGGQPGGPRKPTEGFSRGVITSVIDGVEVYQLRPRGRGSRNMRGKRT